MRHWVYQPKDYGLGNFISATPALLEWHRKTREPYGVWFASSWMAEAFRGMPGMAILPTKPTHPPMLKLGRLELEDGQSDYEAWFHQLGLEIPSRILPWIRNCGLNVGDDAIVSGPPICVFMGCGGSYWRAQKTIGRYVYQDVIQMLADDGHDVMLIGSSSDRELLPAPVPGCLDLRGLRSLTASLAILRRCLLWIGNDSGLYHAAAALRKPGVCMWKATSMGKNLAPFDGVIHMNVHPGDTFDVKQVAMLIGSAARLAIRGS